MSVTPQEQQAFLGEIKNAAIGGWADCKILPSLTMGQAILESYWGTSELAKEANNLFGIKGEGPAGSMEFPTTEYVNGIPVQVTAAFRKYNNIGESLTDHAQLLSSDPRYASVIGVEDYKVACSLIQQDGYATDPNYPQKLIELIQENNLDQWDPKPEAAPAPAIVSQPDRGIWYVKDGDTLSYIGREVNVPWQVLAKFNQLDNPDLIQPGEEIRIPAIYRVKPNDTLSQICSDFGVSDYNFIASVNGIDPDLIYPGQTLYV